MSALDAAPFRVAIENEADGCTYEFTVCDVDGTPSIALRVLGFGSEGTLTIPARHASTIGSRLQHLGAVTGWGEDLRQAVVERAPEVSHRFRQLPDCIGDVARDHLGILPSQSSLIGLGGEAGRLLGHQDDVLEAHSTSPSVETSAALERDQMVDDTVGGTPPTPPGRASFPRPARRSEDPDIEVAR